MKHALVSVLGSVVLFTNGCGAFPSAGVVTTSRGALTSATGAPDIEFRTAEGEVTTLEAIREPIALVAFAAASGEMHDAMSNRLGELATYYWVQDLPVTVAQITVFTGERSQTSPCATRRSRHAHLIQLCDPKGAAWKAFGKPETETVFLFSRHGELLGSGRMDDLRDLADRAEGLAATIRDEAQAQLE